MAQPPVTETKSSAPLTLHGLNVDGVDRCVHCGLCLAYCPTFSELGTEMDSPRGRIMLIKSLAEGRINLTDSTVAHLELCLGCRACETVCPAGVPYGQLIEAARAEIERQRPGGLLRRGFRWINFSLLLPNPSLLRLAAAGLRFYQASGLRRLVRTSGLLRFLPEPLRHWEPLLPDLPSGADRAPLAEVTPATGVRRVRVGLLTGCIQQVAFGPHNQATARVLARNGAEVIAPRAQACCGALHAHAGEHETALALARRTIETFEAAGVEHVVVNTSGCGAHMKAYGTLLADDPAWRGRAARFAASVRDVCEFLAAEPLRGPLREVKRTVTYHDPCHVVHGQKIRTQPRALLAQIPGLRVVELPEADWCCGSAGTYNLTQPEMATRLQERKIAHVRATGADAVVTANPGCIIQIVQGLRAKGSPIQVLHIVELLDQAYQGK
jgi:glycolate oxidase iron-sulfur subunit